MILGPWVELRVAVSKPSKGLPGLHEPSAIKGALGWPGVGRSKQCRLFFTPPGGAPGPRWALGAPGASLPALHQLASGSYKEEQKGTQISAHHTTGSICFLTAGPRGAPGDTQDTPHSANETLKLIGIRK